LGDVKYPSRDSCWLRLGERFEATAIAGKSLEKHPSGSVARRGGSLEEFLEDTGGG